MPDDRLRTYEGADVTVTWSQARCIHAAVCVRSLPGVFDPDRRTWVAPDGAPAADVLATVQACPTGALHAHRRGEHDPETAPPRCTVRVAPDGPLYLHGDVTVTTADGAEVVHDTRVALCRCGRSATKPFCDNSHLAADGREAFRHDGCLPDIEAQPADADGPLHVTLRPDGPLFLQGPFTVVGADGATVPRVKVSLCRCGGSARMPFCDGSHRTNGFQAP